MNDDRLETLVARLKELRDKEKLLKQRIDAVQKKVCDEMERRGALSLELGDYRVNWIQQERVHYYPAKFKKLLSPTLYKRIVKEEVDKAKLEEQVLSGAITMDIVGECTEVRPNKPYAQVHPVEAA